VVEFVDGTRWQRNVYDKKAQRYTEDNRTEHLIARSDKSVAYVTNNKTVTNGGVKSAQTPPCDILFFFRLPRISRKSSDTDTV